MKKFMGIIALLMFGIFLVGCDSKEEKAQKAADEASVNKIYGRIILATDAAAVSGDFNLSTVTNSENVEITWTTENSAIKIEKEMQNDVEYYVAKVTLGDSAALGDVKAVLKKGEAEREWTSQIRVLPWNKPANFAELSDLDDGSVVKITVTLTLVYDTKGYFNPTFTDKDGATFIAYKPDKSFEDQFVALKDKQIEFVGIKGSYKGVAQITSLVWVKAA